MKFIEQISNLAFSYHDTQPGSFWITVTIIIKNLQYLGLMLPNHGWNLWTYYDGLFSLLKTLSHTTLIVPFGIDTTTDFSALAFFFTFILLIYMGFIVIYLFYLGYWQKVAQSKETLQFIYYFILLSTDLFQFPILFTLFSQIMIGQHTLNQQSQLLNPQSAINVITLLFFILFTIIRIIMFRASTFVPINNLLQRFSAFQVISFFNNIFITIIYGTSTQNAEIFLLFFTLILKALEIIFERPFIPWINKIQFQFTCSLILILIPISVSVLTDCEYFSENQLICVIMIHGTFAYFISGTLFTQIFDLTESRNLSSCVSFTQDIYYKYLEVQDNQKQKFFFELFSLIQGHQKLCQKHNFKENNFFHKKCINKTIFCILHAYLLAIKQSSQKYEELLMVFISHLAYHLDKPMLAYVELKRYSCLNQVQSIYFKYASLQISSHFQNLIQQRQYENRERILKQNQYKQLSIQEMHSNLEFQNEFFPRIREIINDKIEFWNSQMKGFNDIYEIESLALKQSTKILALADQMQKHCKIDVMNIDQMHLKINVQDLKLMSIFCSSIMNDYHGTKLCESAINEVYNVERTISQEIITNLPFILEKAINIMISMVKSRGKIVNNDTKLVSSFFGYTEEEFQLLENVSDLMPTFFGQFHDQLLLNFLQTAKSRYFESYNLIFGKRTNDILIPYQIKMDNNFLVSDDYIIIGCLSQLKRTSDYVLFSDDGYLIGTTDNFFKTIIDPQSQITKLNFIGQINIFLLIPSILDLINEIKDQEADLNLSEQINYFDIIIYEDINEIMELTQQLKIDRNTGVQKNRSLHYFQTQIYAEKDLNQENQSSNNTNNKHELKWQSFSKSYLFDQNFQDKIYNILQSEEMQKLKQKDIVHAKMKIEYKTFGKAKNETGYFILEIIYQDKQDEQIELIEPSLFELQNQKYNEQDQKLEKEDRNSVLQSQNQIHPLIQSQEQSNNEHIYYSSNINERNHQDPSLIKENSNQDLKSNNLLKFVKKKVVSIKLEDAEFDANKSKSTLNSKTSSSFAIVTIKQFQQRKKMTRALKTLLVINSIIPMAIIVCMTINLFQVSVNNQEISQTLNNIQGPMLFIQQVLFQNIHLNLEFKSSQFLLKQTLSQMKDMSTTVFRDLNDMYGVFIGIEEQGLLSQIQLDLLYQKSENVSYTYFINLISNVAEYLYQALHYNGTSLLKFFNKQYMDNLLMLRYNLKNVVVMNFQLIDSLHLQFQEQQNGKISQFQLYVVIQIIILFLFIYLQIYLWRQCEQYCQRIILLVGKMQITQATDMIIRQTTVLETLKNSSGKMSWKQSNYYKELFLPIQPTIKTIQTTSRLSKGLTSIGKVSKSCSNLISITGNRQAKVNKNFNTMLNSKINNTSISIKKQVLIITTSFIIVFVYLLGGFLFQQQQQVDLKPTQQLAMEFIRFTSQLDIVATTALITKSQPLFYDKLVKLKVYTVKQINSFRDQRKIIKLFISLYSIYYENLTSIYENIIQSSKISSIDQEILLNLYENDFCTQLSDVIPFCNFVNNSDFNTKYGKPDKRDNNKDYLKPGIQGIVSQLDTFFKQNYQYEINQIDYYPDESQLLVFMNSQIFTNTLMEHFIDTTDGTNLFMDKLMAINQNLISSDITILYSYYLIAGIILSGFWILFFGFWIINTNKRFNLLRLILTNMPIEVLIEGSTLTTLNKLQ